jgi:hypothetical protein
MTVEQTETQLRVVVPIEEEEEYNLSDTHRLSLFSAVPPSVSSVGWMGDDDTTDEPTGSGN